MPRKFLIAEYCAGPFYMGWWLYLRDTNTGEPNADGWGWIHGELPLMHAHRFLTDAGLHPPPLVNHRDQRLAEWFATEFCAGLIIETDERGHNWLFVERVAELPKQSNRRIIRTIRRANASFNRVCAAHGRKRQHQEISA